MPKVVPEHETTGNPNVPSSVDIEDDRGASADFNGEEVRVGVVKVVPEAGQDIKTMEVEGEDGEGEGEGGEIVKEREVDREVDDIEALKRQMKLMVEQQARMQREAEEKANENLQLRKGVELLRSGEKGEDGPKGKMTKMVKRARRNGSR